VGALQAQILHQPTSSSSSSSPGSTTNLETPLSHETSSTTSSFTQTEPIASSVPIENHNHKNFNSFRTNCDTRGSSCALCSEISQSCSDGEALISGGCQSSTPFIANLPVKGSTPSEPDFWLCKTGHSVYFIAISIICCT